jgi:SAM-dependent methyltransferase
MKFSELINIRNQLTAMSSRPIKDSANLELNKIKYFIETQPELFGQVGQTVVEKYKLLQESFDQFEQSLVTLQTAIQNQTAEDEKQWFQESYKLYETLPFIIETADYIFNRRPDLSEEVHTLFRSRITRYSSWQHPAMIIRPGIESFIDDMVAFDPLYLVDDRHELLQPALNRFNEIYQKRLRPYVVTERGNEEILGKLPDGQFGVCLAYNYFNYRPFEVIKQYLTEIYQKLKPGGVLIMTFNDCDRVSAVKLVENNFCTYTPGYLVRELAGRIGYEIEFSWNDPGPSTWIEFRKPGTLTSLRGGQALAKITANPDITFNKDKKLAAELGIKDIDKYQPHQLREQIEHTLIAKK